MSGKTVLSGKYVKGKDACEKERISERKKTLACESDNKAPILNQRNTSCKKVRNVVNTLLTANGKGWSQCSCPNGILKDTHGICPKDKYSCNACYDNFFKETSDNCTIKEFPLTNTSTHEDATKLCKNEGMRLCSYKEVCPKEKGNPPHGGQITAGDAWAPIVNNSYPEFDDWATIGDNVCASMVEDYGYTPTTFTRSKVFCCPLESEGCHYEKCAELSNCEKGFYETKAATETSNRVCKYKQCTCTNGVAGEGETAPNMTLSIA